MALAMYYPVMSHQAAFVCFREIDQAKKRLARLPLPPCEVILAFNIPDSKWTSTRVDPAKLIVEFSVRKCEIALSSKYFRKCLHLLGGLRKVFAVR